MQNETIDLHLEDGDHPRRLLKLDDEWIAWGGETGAVAWKDQLIRHWDEEDDIRAVAVHGRQVALGFESGEVFVYRYDDSAKDFLNKKASDLLVGPVLAASLRDIKFFDENTLVLASEDGLMVWNTETNEQWLAEDVKKHHEGSGIRSVAIRDSHMVSLAMDGRWCLWDLKNRSLVHRGDVCITSKDRGEVLGADAWDRSCRPLFMSKTSLLLPGAAWPQFRLLSPSVTNFDNTEVKGHNESIVTAASRKNFVITVGRDKRVVLWSVNKKFEPELIRILMELESAATDIVWEDDGTVRLACANGTMIVHPKVDLPIEEEDSLQAKSTKSSLTVPDEVEVEDATLAQETPTTDRSNERKVTFADPHENLLGANSALNEKQPSMASTTSSPASLNPEEESDDDIFDKSDTAKSSFIDDEAEDEEDGLHVNKTNLSTNVEPEGSDGNNTDNDDYPMDDYDLPLDHNLGHSLPSSRSMPEQQPPFAPSASPLDLDRGFLCWNHIGSAISRQDDDRSMVDIHFTDAGFRRPITINNSQRFILGSLGEDGGIFCTDINDEDEDEDETNEDNDIVNTFSASTREAVKRSKKIIDPNKPTGSSIYFHRFESFSSVRDKDWRLVLPTGERALGCATGSGWAAVMTNKRFLRTFTNGGNQGQIYWLPGDPVSMAGREGTVAVVYHLGQPRMDGSQCLGYTLLDILGNNVISKGPLSCLSTSSTLTWIGLSNDQTFMAMDSNGIVSMLVKCQTCFEWMPMLDTMGLRKSKDDSFWPTTVFDGKVICVPLKGGASYPDAGRRPITTALGFRIPLAKAMITKTAALEELGVRANIALCQKRSIHEQNGSDAEDEKFECEFLAMSAQVDKVTLKHFAATVEAGKLERALDLVNRLHLPQSYDISKTVAVKYKSLEKLIIEAKKRKFGSDDSNAYESSGDESDDGLTTSDRGRQITPEVIAKRKMEGTEQGRSVRMRFVQ